MPNSMKIKNDLRESLKQQQERGLLNSAKWVAEQLVSFCKVQSKNSAQKFSIKQNSFPVEGTSGDDDDEMDEDLEDTYLLAKSLFDLKEYLRCFHCLKEALQRTKCKNTSSSFKKSLFLCYYSSYLAGEKRKEEEVLEMTGSAVEQIPYTQNSVENKHLKMIESELRGYMNIFDGYLWYLFGIVIKNLIPTDIDQRIEAFVKSICAEPCLWCSWTELGQDAALTTIHIRVPKSSAGNNKKKLMSEDDTFKYVRTLWEASIHLDEQNSEKAKDLYQSVEKHFFDQSDKHSMNSNSSIYIKSQIALCHYQLTDYDSAQRLFEQIIEQEPYRLEHYDTYSNILYVKQMKTKLSSLAQKCIEYEKYRPETCCVIGNYYSLRGDHARAVQYFQRALKLDRRYLSAWTLMGHEYVEMKNTTAAVHAYRTAVDINSRDYRAWYGLGQTYEVVGMQLYALFYYSKATMLKPYDGRMWCALAGCYEQLERYDEAIKCYRRSLKYAQDTQTSLNKLAELCERLGESEQASHYYSLLEKHRQQQQQQQQQQQHQQHQPHHQQQQQQHHHHYASMISAKEKFEHESDE